LAAQLPAGAQLSQIVQDTAPGGATTYRAQFMQNGVASELTFSGAVGAATPSAVATLGTTPPVGTVVPNNSGFVGGVGTPIGFETLPTPVQTAFTSQVPAGSTVTNIMFVPAANGAGGMFRGFANGQPFNVRLGANGQILPNAPAATAVASNTSTNELKVDDLPQAVRDALKEKMPNAQVTRIRKMDGTSGDLFDITLRSEDQTTSLQVSENGTIVRDNRDLPVAVSAPEINTNEPPKLVLNSLPTTVRDAITVRTDPSNVKMLFLTNYHGRTAYTVDYLDKDSIRNRFWVGKDGLVIDTQTNIYGITNAGHTIVVADLPAAARSTIEEHVPDGTVTKVDLSMRGLTPVYVVSYRKNGEVQQMVVTREGLVMDAVGAAAGVETGRERK
jgi:hypothetical protein